MSPHWSVSLFALQSDLANLFRFQSLSLCDFALHSVGFGPYLASCSLGCNSVAVAQIKDVVWVIH